VLESVAQSLRDLELTVPDRQYITVGTPVADCEQLTVSLVQLYNGLPGAQQSSPTRCDGPLTAVLSVQLLRSTPTVDSKGRPPTAATLQVAGETLVTDAWALLLSACRCDEYGLGYIADVAPVEPQGGYAGATMNLVVAVP